MLIFIRFLISRQGFSLRVSDDGSKTSLISPKQRDEMKRRRGEGHVVEPLAGAAAASTAPNHEALPLEFASQGYVVMRKLIPPRVLPWLRFECDVLSAPVDLAASDCMVDPLEGVNMEVGALFSGAMRFIPVCQPASRLRTFRLEITSFLYQ